MTNYKRIAIKISGEALGTESDSFNINFIHELVNNIIKLVDKYEIIIIVGGGNFFRGKENKKLNIHQAKADQMGMLATIMNGIFLKEIFEQYNQNVSLLSNINCSCICETFNIDYANKLLKEKYILICVGGISVPYFTTDTAVTLKACELKCDLIMKATKVNGIYSKDPTIYNDAVFYDTISFEEVMKNNIEVMDKAAFEMANKNNIPIIVFSIHNNILDILENKIQHTKVTNN